MLAHTYNPNMQEAGSGRLLVQVQPRRVCRRCLKQRPKLQVRACMALAHCSLSLLSVPHSLTQVLASAVGREEDWSVLVWFRLGCHSVLS